jgi:hypothetical protein
MYGVHKVQIPLPGCFVSASTLLQNCGATNMVPTQKDKPFPLSTRKLHFKTHTRSWKNVN